MKNYYYGLQDDQYNVTADEIIVEEDEPKFTGLYDAKGQKLYRKSDRIKVGFDLGSSSNTGPARGPRCS